ncbi:MAG TPA: hypothetical protein VFP10_08595 [Candidatus Eisenbacteria bacterium]|nr:hypothetical protein [Candidatus Eisenbacteria bacterium]
MTSGMFVTRWMKPLAMSLVVHGAAVTSGAWLLRHGNTEPVITDTYRLALVLEPALPGPIGDPGGAPGAPLPAIHPVPKPRESVSEQRVETPQEPSPAIVPAEASSTRQDTAGSASGEGLGGGGTGEGSGVGSEGGAGGGAPTPETYQPPRLLAGALPLDPDDVIAQQVPAEIPVRLRVGPDGRVRDIVPEIENLPAPVLDALRRSADAMRFAPARSSGKPVEGWFSMSFVYRR